MSADFSALLRYRRTPEVLANIESLENQTSPFHDDVVRVWNEYRFFALGIERSSWVTNTRAAHRPKAPSLFVSLKTVDGFFFTFGGDVARVYHPLRWRFFLEDPRWQAAMTGACEKLAGLVNADAGLMTASDRPLIEAFHEGKSYDDCVAADPNEHWRLR